MVSPDGPTTGRDRAERRHGRWGDEGRRRSQRSGRRLRTSNHCRRRAAEPVDREIEAFYDRLLAGVGRPEARDGEWQLLDQLPAWDGNTTADKFVAGAWRAGPGRLIVAVNYGDERAHCYLRLPFPDLQRRCVLRDLVNPGIEYERDGGELATRGLFLDVGPWGHQVFEVAST